MNEQLARFVSFAFASADLLLEVGRDGCIRFAMGAASGLADRRDEDNVGRPWAALFDDGDQPFVTALAENLGIGTRCGPLPVHMAVKAPDGTARMASLSAVRFPGTEDRMFATLSLAAAGSAPDLRRDLETRLLDRESFAAEAARRAAAQPFRALEVTFLDLRGLDRILRRDAAADAGLIRRIAALLATAAIDGGAAGRLGETRFGVVHRTDDAGFDHCMAQVAREGLEAGLDLGLAEQSFDLSVESLDRGEALRAIRFAVNRFAETGLTDTLPTSVAESFERLVGDTLRRMSDFSTLVREARFELSFQPIIELETGMLHHFEVLSRFEDRQSPFETIQFAEEIGLIECFDIAVCMRALAHLKTRTEDRGPPLALAVNISGRSIGNPLFVRLLQRLLQENRDQARRLSLELTESAAIEDLVQADRVLQEIRGLGYAVFLDDFGAGAASFPYLQALRVDGVKIDGAYISRLGQSPRDDAMLRGIVRLCGDLGIATIAERVETAEQARQLRAMGVRYGQGYLLGLPTPDPVWTPPHRPAPESRGPGSRGPESRGPGSRDVVGARRPGLNLPRPV